MIPARQHGEQTGQDGNLIEEEEEEEEEMEEEEEEEERRRAGADQGDGAVDMSGAEETRLGKTCVNQLSGLGSRGPLAAPLAPLAPLSLGQRSKIQSLSHRYSSRHLISGQKEEAMGQMEGRASKVKAFSIGGPVWVAEGFAARVLLVTWPPPLTQTPAPSVLAPFALFRL